MSSAGPTPVVVVDRVSKWFGEVSALNDVSVSIRPGVTGLLGPNGAGKSTFLKVITGLLRPATGTVTVLGEPIGRHPAIYRRIGVCPDHDGFYESMSGRRWIEALVRLNGLDVRAARSAAGRALKAVDLLDVADRTIASYSKGMRQRVKLAQALAHDPELLVLDEPLNGMDPLMRRRTIALIRDLGRAGRSAIVSSHVLHEIESMTSAILLMDHGRIIAEGDVRQIRALIDAHPHRVAIRAGDPRALGRHLLGGDDVVSVKFEEELVVVETAHPDAFYARLTMLAASGAAGDIEEITSPDDNLQAVFRYLVKS